MKNEMKKPIGVFDSGIGGLTVLKEIVRLLPWEDYVYFGDSKRAPYGTKSRETITHFAFQDAGFLMSRGVKAIVVACNTVSSNSLEELREKIDIPVFEVIGPGSRAGALATTNGRIAVIGTNATISSGAYSRRLRTVDPNLQVMEKSCPLFVPIAEEGSHMWKGDIARLTAEMYLNDIRESGADVLILGCTHYPLLKEVIESTMGEGTMIIDSATSVAQELLSMYENGENRGEKGKIEIYTSDSRDKFLPLSREILDRDDFTVVQVDIEKY